MQEKSFKFTPPIEVIKLCQNVSKSETISQLKTKINDVEYNVFDIKDILSIKNLKVSESNVEFLEKYPKSWWTQIISEDHKEKIDDMKNQFRSWLMGENLDDFFCFVSFKINEIPAKHFFKYEEGNFFEIKEQATYGVKGGIDTIIDYINEKSFSTFEYGLPSIDFKTIECVRFLYTPTTKRCIEKGQSNAPFIGSLIPKENSIEHIQKKEAEGYVCTLVQKTSRLDF